MATKTHPIEELQEWRDERFQEMGFNEQQSAALAVSRDDGGLLIDTHKVQDMMQGGCTPEQAIMILL